MLLSIPKRELRYIAVAGGGGCCRCVVSQTTFQLGEYKNRLVLSISSPEENIVWFSSIDLARFYCQQESVQA